jgi:Cell wall-associated hydrolases (invasion-associated proteins)
MEYRKIATILLTAILLASCGAGRTTVSNKKTASTTLQDDILEYGRKYMGRPYRYAGKGPASFDCSGYTSFVFKQFGYSLSSSSAGQDSQVPTIARKQDLQRGDLVFFEGRRKNGLVGHVGIVTETRPNGEFRFIHASTGHGVIITSSTEPYYASRYLRGGRVLEGNNPYVAQRKTEVKEGEDKRLKRHPAFTPATAKDEPATLQVPIIVAQKTDAETKAKTGAVLVAEQAGALSQNKEEPIILVQTDPLKNPPLGNNQSADNQKKQENDTVVRPNKEIVLREDSLIIPEPVVMEAEENTPKNHTVKTGETLYSISRQYNCSVDQLKAWNPQLGTVLKTGEALLVYANRTE